ncbi:MAG: FAD-dependent 5-carboxymethylaminomethyl-2-thiouridine(34) oxidoreductase MnmC [Pseudomonadota bacterium]
MTDQGTLRSLTFDDIYYSPDDGLAETEYVFISGNDLPRRLADHDSGRPFVIGELGFGTGLNVLAACKCHEAFGRGPLNIWTVEGFPLSRTAFAEVQAQIAIRWPGLKPWAERLVDTYPEPVPGQTQVVLSRGITLTIAFGPVRESLNTTDIEADAWFLDGFAPSRNPEMWSEDVMHAVARLTRKAGTAATFSVASGVRAALETAGFSWRKSPGFGRKKHMLRAELTAAKSKQNRAPWYARPAAAPQGKVAIIGAGIAGASVARALESQGVQPVIFGVGSRDEAASSNPAGLVMPRLDAGDTPAARFYRDAFLYAAATYRALEGRSFTPCDGSLAMEPDRADRIEATRLWPDGLLSSADGKVHVRQAGMLEPRAAADAMMSNAILVEESVGALEHDSGWFITTRDDDQRHGPFSAVALATGAAQELWPGAPIAPSLGQVDVFAGDPPPSIITDGHYVAPYGEHVLTGATYARFDGGTVATSPDNTEHNRDASTQLLGRDPGRHLASRASLRATTPDRHPIAGPLYDEAEAITAYAGLRTGLKQDYPSAPYQNGLYALTGLGSRGLVTAPILGAHVTAEITGGVSPLTSDVAAMVHPGRFLIRDLKRGKINP